MEITKREIIASVTIIAFMLLVGVFISDKINDYVEDSNAKYNKALKIEDEELFKYGMETNIGNAFVYGELKAKDPVSYDGVDGKYLYIKKIDERYTMKTRTVTTTDSKGRTKTKTETYWEWDVVKREEKTAKEVTFLNQEFNSKQFYVPGEEYIKTIKISSDYRCKYYAIPAVVKGTIFTVLKDNNIGTNDTTFYRDKNITETLERLESDNHIIMFWIIWIVITAAITYGFYYLDNRWLEN